MSKPTEGETNGDSSAAQADSETLSQNGATSEPPPPNLNMMSRTLSSLQDQVKFADTKANFTAGLHILLCGFVVSSADKLANIPPTSRAWAFYCAVMLLILYAAAALVSMTYVVLTIIPRLGGVAPLSRMHFKHIKESYGKDYGKYSKDVQSMMPCDWAEEISTQIINISHIALTKHRLIRAAVIWTLVTLFFWFGGLIAVLISR